MKYIMSKSIGEFITEYETGYNTLNGNNSIEKAYAECAAAISLAKCYTEQAVLMEFAVENGFDSMNIVQEAGDEKKESIFQRAKTGLGNAKTKIIEFFKSIYRKISGYVADKRMSDLKDAISKLDDDDEIPGVVAAITLFPEFIELFESTTNRFGEELNDSDITKGSIDSMVAKLDEFTEAAKAKIDAKTEKAFTARELKQSFNAKFEKGHIQEVLKKINKNISEYEKKAKSNEGKENVSNEELISAANDKARAVNLDRLLNATTKAYDVALQGLHKGHSSLKGGMHKVEKDKKKAEKESAKTESYFV
jgi:hypothetical protein